MSNCYTKPARLLVLGVGEIESAEGTTHGDPISMAVYVLLPLMWIMKGSFTYQQNLDTDEDDFAKHVAYANDLTGARKLKSFAWWNELVKHGISIGYYVNSSKCWLLAHEKHIEEENRIFHVTEIK